MTDDSTVVFTDIHKALNFNDKEAQSQPACLLGVGGDLNGTIFDLTEPKSSFGRSHENTYPIDFRGVSRKHFQVSLLNSQASIVDLGSSNGTYLNNTKVLSESPLRKGDVVKVGSVALKFLPAGDPERLSYEKLQREANTDGLTSCFNKTYFNNACDIEVKKSKITKVPLSLIIFDLDHFKKLNDNYGHDAGDFVLKEMARIIRANGIRDKDVFARYGGEEFVILLPETNLKRSYEIAERLRDLIEKHNFNYEGSTLPVTASIGVADFRSGVEEGVDLFKRADKAVYTSKENGRNQVSFYKE